MLKSLLVNRKTGSRRACFLAIQLVFLVFGSLLCSGNAQAYPWMIKHGYANCATCHSDPSGGELLTGYGRVLSEEFLSTQWKKSEVARARSAQHWALTRAAHSKSAEDVKSAGPVPAPEAAPAAESAPASAVAVVPTASSAAAPVEPAATTADAPAPAVTPGADTDTASSEPSHASEGHEFFQPFFGAVALPDTLLLGGSVRVASLYEKGNGVRVFPMQFDLSGDYKLFGHLHLGGSLGLAKVPIGKPEARPAQITHDQGDGWNLISRTHCVRYELGDGAYTVSAGRLNLPFGIRMSEHIMWVRQKTATDRESAQEHGVSLNMNFNDWRFEVMAIAGNYQLNPDQFRKRGYSGYAEVNAWDGGSLGVSSLITHAASDALNPGSIADTRQAHGAFLRASLGHEVVLMAEGDLLLHTQTKPGYVGFSQLDFEITRGVHVFGTGEIFDNGYPKGVDESTQPRLAGQGKPQLGGWLSAQWFFISHFDFRVDAIIRQAEPFQLMSQIHVYL